MEAHKGESVGWRQWGISALVLLAGIFADNALSTSVAMPLAGQIVAVIGGLVVGSLTVLTFQQREGAHIAAAALYSALTVIACTLTLPHIEYIALLVLCIVTVVACLASSRPHPMVARPATAMHIPVETRDSRR